MVDITMHVGNQDTVVFPVHTSVPALQQATQIFAPKLKGDQRAELLGLLVGGREYIFFLNHSQVQKRKTKERI